jgi:hypothetical protein
VGDVSSLGGVVCVPVCLLFPSVSQVCVHLTPRMQEYS